VEIILITRIIVMAYIVAKKYSQKWNAACARMLAVYVESEHRSAMGGPEVPAMSAILLGLMLIIILSVELLPKKKS